MARQESPQQTRTRILEAAEELFALKGFDATSIRDITERADCNIAAVNYHFGGKDKLYAATARDLVTDLRDHRIRKLEKDLLAIEEPVLEDFLRSFASGFLAGGDQHPRSGRFMLFFAREMLDPHLPPHLFFEEFIRPLMDFTVPILQRLTPGLGRREASWCMMSLVAQLHHQLKLKKHFTEVAPERLLLEDSTDYLQHFVRFSSAGIRAYSREVEK